MNIRCKFRCTDIKDNGPGQPKEVDFATQYDPALPEDQRYTKATPWGTLTVSIDNPVALAELRVGATYYVDLIPAPDGPRDPSPLE